MTDEKKMDPTYWQVDHTNTGIIELSVITLIYISFVKPDATEGQKRFNNNFDGP